MQKKANPVQSTEIVKLPSNTTRGGFKYELDRRNQYAALYKKYSEKDYFMGYEVFHIRIDPPRIVNNKTIEARERFPHDEAFGTWAWSFYPSDYVGALIKFGEISGRKSKR